MTIRITDEPHTDVTLAELARFTREYDLAFGYYAGIPPTLEEYIINRRAEDEMLARQARLKRWWDNEFEKHPIPEGLYD